MKIAILGAGGVGGYFGGRMAAAGQQIAFVARGAHGKAMAELGLKITGDLGDVLTQVTVTDEMAALAEADLVMHCTKRYGLEESARQLAGILPQSSLVVPFQNGIDSAETLAAELGDARVAQGVAYISAEIASPGHIKQVGQHARLVVAARQPEQQERLEAFARIAQESGIDSMVGQDPRFEAWMKFVRLTVLAGATASERSTLGPLRESPEGQALLAGLTSEAEAAGRAEGVALPADMHRKIEKMIAGLPGGMRASMALDLERGNRLELPWLNGAVLRIAEKHGLPAPFSKSVVERLTPFVQGSA